MLFLKGTAIPIPGSLPIGLLFDETVTFTDIKYALNMSSSNNISLFPTTTKIADCR